MLANRVAMIPEDITSTVHVPWRSSSSSTVESVIDRLTPEPTLSLIRHLYYLNADTELYVATEFGQEWRLAA